MKVMMNLSNFKKLLIENLFTTKNKRDMSRSPQKDEAELFYHLTLSEHSYASIGEFYGSCIICLCNMYLYNIGALCNMKSYWYDEFTMSSQSCTKYFHDFQNVFMWNSTLREKFNFYFSGVFCWYWQTFHFRQRLSTRL